MAGGELQISAVIFDLDGTLIDSLADIATAMNDALVEHDLPEHPEEAYLQFVGAGVVNLARRALPADREDEIDAVVTTYRARYAERMLQRTVPYPGVPEVVRALRANGVKTAVLSNKPHGPTQRLVEHFFGGLFEHSFGERAGVPKKPDPTAALELAHLLDVEPARCAFVGDSEIDMKTAVAAGMLPLAVAWGYGAREELVRDGARHVLTRAEQLLDLLK
jgi:phosphoglycolate phosphatase